MKEFNFLGITIKYNSKNIKILDSYKVQSKVIMELILMKFQQDTKFKSKREMKSWLKEWKAHNRLYNLGLYRKHTKNCDLEESEKKHRLLAYNILGL